MTKTELVDVGYKKYRKRMLELDKTALFVGILDEDSELAISHFKNVYSFDNGIVIFFMLPHFCKNSE